MRALDWIAEQRIQEAMRQGELDALPGTGAPLTLDDDLLVPEEVRSVYRVLKNAGYVPQEVQARRELQEARAAIQELDPESEQYRRALHKLHYMNLRLAEQRGSGLRADAAYHRKLLLRFARG